VLLHVFFNRNNPLIVKGAVGVEKSSQLHVFLSAEAGRETFTLSRVAISFKLLFFAGLFVFIADFRDGLAVSLKLGRGGRYG